MQETLVYLLARRALETWLSDRHRRFGCFAHGTRSGDSLAPPDSGRPWLLALCRSWADRWEL